VLVIGSTGEGLDGGRVVFRGGGAQLAFHVTAGSYDTDIPG
jgi:hypothetical protein